VGRVPDSLPLHFQFYARTNSIIVTAFLAILILARVSFQSVFFFFFEAPHEGFLIQLGLAFSSGALILVLELEVTATLNTEL
jgi:hypothetical protein